MGAFTSTDIQKYQARYSVQKQAPGYRSISSKKSRPRHSVQQQRKTDASIWIMNGFSTETPPSRTGYCWAPTTHETSAVICYGSTPDNTLLSDFWLIDFDRFTCREIPVDQSQIMPRTGARGVLIDDNMWIFGGFNDTGILSDLHIVNMTDGQVARPPTSGPEPGPRINHVMAYCNGKILIYGGMNSIVLQELFLLDVETLVWTQIEIGHGRASAAYTICNNILWVYGSSQAPGFITFDFQATDSKIIPVSGTVPPSQITNAAMTSFGHYIVLFGGDLLGESDDERPFGPLYLFNTLTRVWSRLPVAPDGITTSLKDGEVDSNGDFLLPLVAQAGTLFHPGNRELVAVLGSPSTDPMTASTILLGQHIAALNLQEDMIAALRR